MSSRYLSLGLLLLTLASCSSLSSLPKSTDRDPSSIPHFFSFCSKIFKNPSPVELGSPFQAGRPTGSHQIGVDPRSLIPTKDLSTLDNFRLQKAEEFARDKAIYVNNLGFIIDGHHRLKNALLNSRSVDTVVVASDSSIDPRFLIRNELRVKNKMIFSGLELSHLNQSFSQSKIPHVMSYKNREAELFYAHFSSLDKAVQAVLLKLLDLHQNSPKIFSEVSKKLEEQLKISISSTFYENLRERHLNPAEIQNHLENFEKKSPEERTSWLQKADYWNQRSRHFAEWQNYYFSKIPLEKMGGNKIRAKIADQVFEGFMSGDSVILEVSPKLIRHPSWNPLDHLEEVAMNTWGGPSAYKVSLDLDGKFYLYDGNHRFAIYGASKKSVRVKLFLRQEDGKAYIYTSPLRNCFDDWGISQPSEEDLAAVSRKSIRVESLVPENMRRLLMPIEVQP